MLTGTFEGTWWLPATPSVRVRGSLHLAWDHAPRLEAHGLLAPGDIGDAVRMLLVGGRSYAIVLGKLADGRAVTLQECSSARGGNVIHFDEPDTSVLNFQAQRAWMGAFLPVPDTETFSQLHVGLTCLDDLAPRPLAANLDDITIEVIDVPASEHGRSVRREYLVRSNGPILVDAWIDGYVRPLRSLAAFATGRDVAIERLAVSDRTGADAADLIEIVERRREPNLYPDRPLLPDEMLFDLSSLPASFEEALRRWLAVADDLRAVLDLVLGPLFAPFMYEEHRFLNLAQAAESFHRIRIGGAPLPPDQYAKRIDAVVDVCPPELKEWLGRALQFGNQRSFAERLRALTEMHPWLGSEVIGDVPQFVRRVTDTRNYHSHWDQTTIGQAARGTELWPLCEQLAVLLEACLLGEIGFSEDLAAESIRRASRHYSAIRLNPLLFPATSGPATH